MQFLKFPVEGALRQSEPPGRTGQKPVLEKEKKKQRTKPLAAQLGSTTLNSIEFIDLECEFTDIKTRSEPYFTSFTL